MAYSTIADSELDPESPGTTTLFTKLRDNPEAMASGLSGATRIVTAALDQTSSTEAVSTATIRDGAITAPKLASTLDPWVELDSAALALAVTSFELDGFSSDYDSYKVIISGATRNGSAAALRMRVKSGGTVQTDTEYSLDGAASANIVSLGSLNQNIENGSDIEIRFNYPLSTTKNKMFNIAFVGGTGTTTAYNVRYLAETKALSGLYFDPTSGDFNTGGTAKLYGMKE